MQSLYVPIFQNLTLWRKLEYSLTREVIRKIQERTDIQILSDPQKADGKLLGKITMFQKSILTEDTKNQAFEASITLGVEIQLVNQKGESLLHRSLADTRAFLVSHEGGLEVAKKEAFQEMAEKILFTLEDWNQRSKESMAVIDKE
ncbi:MAG: DUF2559 family protein [Planctomycetota bacterium]|nr:MAG: DUF2559 family protein [Planctomycetota bacterium]